MANAHKIGALERFSPPGYPYVDDELTSDQGNAWSAQISDWMDAEITPKMPDPPCRIPLTQFFNGCKTPFDLDQPPASISWIAFPKRVTENNPTDSKRWEAADAYRHNQDEYLEWTVKKDSAGRIKYVTFSCEGPEYWAFIAKSSPSKLLGLYKSLNPKFANRMKQEDLFVNGEYEPYNQWNGVMRTNPGSDDHLTTMNHGCIAHLAQKNNTLSAEVNIAAQATVIRKRNNGEIISDPIASEVNTLAKGENKISIADPVAIYIKEFDTSNFGLDVDGSGENPQSIPAGTFTWVRGNIDKGMGMRLLIEVPTGTIGTGANAGRQLDVSDILGPSDQRIRYGAQFADHITMTVNGVVIPNTRVAAAEQCCCGDGDAKFSLLAANQAFIGRA
ncbi:hypothetical protein GGR51DRAFT_578640 [Nemania sp. FL0031]|nr:hypothetical protein GGR51DRAFT_578640 [Nemania sp. FL0031]